jgi:hypothetical protein
MPPQPQRDGRTAPITEAQQAFDFENSTTEAQLAFETRQTAESIRPVNTNYAYLPKREEFKVQTPPPPPKKLKDKNICLVFYKNRRGLIHILADTFDEKMENALLVFTKHCLTGSTEAIAAQKMLVQPNEQSELPLFFLKRKSANA